MSLYQKRITTMDIVSDKLFNEDGEQVTSITVTGLVVDVGGKKIHISICRGGTQLGEFSKGSRIEIKVTEKEGYAKETTLFKVEV